MPDISSAPAIGSPTALYPQPPSQQGALSGNPGQVLDLMRSITQNQMLQNELKARTAIGQAYQGALQPDNTVDPEKLRAGLADPAASWMLPEAIQHALGIARSQFDLRTTQDQAVRSLLGSLPPNATDEQLRQARTQLSRMGVPAALIE